MNPIRGIGTLASSLSIEKRARLNRAKAKEMKAFSIFMLTSPNVAVGIAKSHESAKKRADFRLLFEYAYKNSRTAPTLGVSIPIVFTSSGSIMKSPPNLE
ncbi:hypothetical protein ADU37_CDS15110 [Thermococcus sp. 2319x1]|nr:hypothetical protein ADU37_CDS15110 [Thermococcus sp. 2319x1]